VSRRRPLIAFALVIVLGLAALLAAGAADQRFRAFSIGVPDVGPVATLSPGQQVCEGPVDSQASFGAIRMWTASISAPGSLAVSVRDADTSRELAHGNAVLTPAATSPDATLNSPVAARRAVTVCIRNRLPAPLSLLGSAPPSGSMKLTLDGKPVTGLGLALVMLQRPRSLLSEVPAMFARAALFRPGWVGEWTFWVLLAAVVLAIGFGAVAVGFVGASADTDERESL
jgi:hypothetical protein